jgi:hypothetical protein
MRILIVGKCVSSIHAISGPVSSEKWDEWAFGQLGHECNIASTLSRDENVIVDNILKYSNIDLILYAVSHGVTPSVIAKTKHAAKASCVSTFDHMLWGGEAKSKNFIECAKLTDRAFHTGGAPEARSAIIARQGCEPILNLKGPAHVHTGRPIFIGGTKGRERFINIIKRNGCEVAGTSRSNRLDRQDLLNACRARSVTLGQIRVAGREDIYDKNAPHYRSDRLNVQAGFGACMIHPYHVNIENDYEPNREILIYRTYDEMESLINKYRNNASSCCLIGAAAAARAQKDHTYVNRAKIILESM